MTRIRPVLRYPGAKWGLAPWIISHFPPHEAYVEPFFGSGSVLLRKPPERSELVNDLDDQVVTFFRMLRERPEDLARAVALTPYARRELEAAQGVAAATLDDLEIARLLAVRAWQGRATSHNLRTGWIGSAGGEMGGSQQSSWAKLPGSLAAAADRFRGVAIECRPALDVLRMVATMKHARDTLIYADPPYLGRAVASGEATQRRFHLYRNEMTVAEHAELLEALDRHPGPVVLSGYASDLYDDRLAHWDRLETTTRNQVNSPRTEVLWLNPVAASQATLRLAEAIT